MLSKIRTASVLDGQFWIKDQRWAKPQLCVLELDALYVLSEASGGVHRPRDSVLRELFKVIEVRIPCQHEIYRASSILPSGWVPTPPGWWRDRWSCLSSRADAPTAPNYQNNVTIACDRGALSP